MQDWNRIAAARGLDIPPDQLERIRTPLEALDRAFSPLLARIPLEVEPAVIFVIAPERDA